MHPLLQRLVLDHKNLEFLLAILERQLDDVHAGQEHDLDLLCELVEYVESYEDQVHHPTEDLIFARFKSMTEEKRVAVETLEDQHLILAEMTRTFRCSLEAIVNGGMVLRNEVESQGRAILKTLRQHVDLEEREVFGLIAERLDAADWAILEGQVPKIDDPVFGTPDAARFRALFRHFTQIPRREMPL
jgi:hemerythrin-like domain-containing protein